MGAFREKYIMFELKNCKGIMIMTLKSDTIFREKFFGSLKNNTRYLINFHAGGRKLFCPKHIKF